MDAPENKINGQTRGEAPKRIGMLLCDRRWMEDEDEGLQEPEMLKGRGYMADWAVAAQY